MLKDTPKFIFTFVAVFLLCRAVSGETLPFRNYTTADGLGHDRVEKIVKDSRGFLWFCTGEGLARFDGYEFKNFTQADGLPHRRVTELIETRDGKYIVGTYAGIAIFNPMGESRRWNDVEGRQIAPPNSKEPPMFQVLRPPDAKQDKKSWTITALLEKRDGTIWAATLDGVYRLENVGDEWIFHRLEAEAWRGKNLEFIALFEDSRGGFWIGSPSGAFRVSADGAKTDVIKEKLSTQFFYEDRQGQIWLGGGWGEQGLSVAVFPEGRDTPVIARSYTTKDGLTANDWLNDVLETSDGRILVAIVNGVCEFLPEAKENEPKFRVFLNKDAASLLEDEDGNIWIGSGSGAFKVTRGGGITLFDDTDFPKPAPFIFNGIFAGEGREVFFSEGSNALFRFDGEKFTSVNALQTTGRSWGWNQVDFRSRRTGEWWINSNQKAMRYPNVRFEDLSRTKPIGVYNFTPPGMNENSAFFRFFEDSRGDVWLGMLDNPADAVGTTLARWERAADKMHVYVPRENGIPFNNAPTAFAEDGAGNVWIGYYFDGLARYGDGKFRMFNAEDGMVTGIVNAIYNDSAGRVWIATGGNGVIRIDNPADEKPRLVNLTVAEGLSSNQTTCLTEDNFGRIYVGTGRGVTRIEPETGRIKIYSQADGLPHSSVRTCGRDREGALWFVQHLKMLVRLVPKADETTKPPPVFIGSVRVNGEPARKISELGETSVQNLEFNSDERQIQIDFLALGFATGETLRYQYKLGDADWSEPSGRRTENFNLSPGNYSFEVRAVNSEGVASDVPARVSFSIARPIWQRWWFLALAVFIFGAAIFALYRYRLKKTEQVRDALAALSQSRQERLVEIERVRTRITTDLHDDIGSSLSQIAVLSEFAQSGNGQSAESLRQISTVSNELVEAMSDIVWAINPRKDSLHDLLQRMRRFASDVFTARDIKFEFDAPEFEENVQIGANIRREIFVVFKESVNNIARHSGATRAKIKLEIAGQILRLEISDNGRGFDTGRVLGDDFSPSKGGNGLLNMRQRARELEGNCEIISSAETGTRITLEIPLTVQTAENNSAPLTRVGSESSKGRK